MAYRHLLLRRIRLEYVGFQVVWGKGLYETKGARYRRHRLRFDTLDPSFAHFGPLSLAPEEEINKHVIHYAPWPSMRKDTANRADGNFFACVARNLLVGLEQQTRADTYVGAIFKGAAPEARSSPLNIDLCALSEDGNIGVVAGAVYMGFWKRLPVWMGKGRAVIVDQGQGNLNNHRQMMVWEKNLVLSVSVLRTEWGEVTTTTTDWDLTEGESEGHVVNARTDKQSPLIVNYSVVVANYITAGFRSIDQNPSHSTQERYLLVVLVQTIYAKYGQHGIHGTQRSIWLFYLATWALVRLLKSVVSANGRDDFHIVLGPVRSPPPWAGPTIMSDMPFVNAAAFPRWPLVVSCHANWYSMLAPHLWWPRICDHALRCVKRDVGGLVEVLGSGYW
ncbi:hypothetical protein BJV78DRAFT_1156385 [Lactifluus subvellereus]|nr:hypothetical protein BJV78DRAFT_1156385 [Lactifluus subvellereus]